MTPAGPERLAQAAAGAKKIVLAAAAGPHGVRGAVRLKLFSGSVDSLRAHKRLFAGERALKLRDVRESGRHAVAIFDGVSDRDQAAALTGQELWVPREELPPLGEDEYYHADLIGLGCVGPDGAALGTVGGVENFGAGDLLEIVLPDGRTSLVPFRPGVADLAEGRVVVDPDFLA